MLAGLVITGEPDTGVLTAMDKVWVPVPPAPVACKVTDVVPAAVGVPERTPVVALRVRPAGKGEAAKLVGELVAVIAYENGAPKPPDALPGLVIATVLVSRALKG